MHSYPKKYTPLQVQQLGYSGPLHTIVHLLRNAQKTRVELKLYFSLIVVYNTQEPSFSRQCEF